MPQRIDIYVKPPEASAGVRWRVLPHPKARKRRDRVKADRGGALSVGETLLRNTALSCALFLTLMALKNADTPFTRRVTDGVRSAVTARVDWDSTLGKLSFVRAIVPEAALVFLSAGEKNAWLAPVEGALEHEYSPEQPWLLYEAAPGAAVRAAIAGTVTVAGQGADGGWVALIAGDDGGEALYGYMSAAKAAVGARVEVGDVIGAAGADGRLYFEARRDGAPVAPDDL